MTVPPDETEGPGAQRLDKWLTYARFAKTRAVAQKLVVGGKVRINRVKVTNPSRLVRAADVLTIATPREIRVIRVIGFSDRRVGAPETPTLYEPVDTGGDNDAGSAGSREERRE